MTVLFVVSVIILIQAYAGYPLSLAVLRLLLRDRARHREEDSWPTVTLVISAYNEEAVIARKIENSFELDYPPDRIERVVVSDASTDGTNVIVQSYGERGVRLRSFPGRQGKVACLNQVLPDLRTDLVVFSDANSMYEKSSLGKLARHFTDPRVGCVCGELRYSNPRGLAAGDGERIYWSYERFIKRLESALGSLLGANGAIYACRRELVRPVDPLMFCDDVIPIAIALGGHLTIYDLEARCTEDAVPEATEMRRRRRHASFGLRSMLHLCGLALRRGRLLILYQCVSHRILRWSGGLAMAGILASSPFLPEPWREIALAGQGVFYGAAAAGFLASRLSARVIPLYLPYYFLVLTAAGLGGLWAFLRKSDQPYWDPRR